MNIPELYEIYKKHPSVQTDTRRLKKGDIFFALKGPNFNGNEFASKAIDQGSSFAVIDEKKFEIPGKTILVDDALITLQQLAKHHRQQFNIPFQACLFNHSSKSPKGSKNKKYECYQLFAWSGLSRSLTSTG